MRKVLFVATVDQHIRHFHIPYLKWFKDKGYQVSVATNGDENIPYVDIKHDVPFHRSPYSFNNLKALLELRRILIKNEFNIIHTHTPVASILIRLMNFFVGKSSQIIYTAHGFHFFKGASLFNWLVYYPIEKALSYCTDCLITINSEDYELVVKNNFGAKKIYLVDGVGVNLEKYKEPTVDEKIQLRTDFSINVNDFVLIYVGELSKRKNQYLLLQIISILSGKIKNLKLLLVGKGAEESNLKRQCSELGLNSVVDFLGYRHDINNLMKVSDLCVSTALQEGLPVNIMEALSTGLPCVVSNCRGNRDIVSDSVNGFVVDTYDKHLFAEKIYQMYDDLELHMTIKSNTVKSVIKYSEDSVLKVMSEIYCNCEDS